MGTPKFQFQPQWTDLLSLLGTLNGGDSAELGRQLEQRDQDLEDYLSKPESTAGGGTLGGTFIDSLFGTSTPTVSASSTFTMPNAPEIPVAGGALVLAQFQVSAWPSHTGTLNVSLEPFPGTDYHDGGAFRKIAGNGGLALDVTNFKTASITALYALDLLADDLPFDLNISVGNNSTFDVTIDTALVAAVYGLSFGTMTLQPT